MKFSTGFVIGVGFINVILFVVYPQSAELWHAVVGLLLLAVAFVFTGSDFYDLGKKKGEARIKSIYDIREVRHKK